jgi:hypothetical protein
MKGPRHQNTFKTNCPATIQFRKRDGICRIQGDRELEHNHPLLISTQDAIPGDVQETGKDSLKVGVDRSRILEFLYYRTDRVFSQFQFAALDSQDLPIAMAANTDLLLEHLQDKGG